MVDTTRRAALGALAVGLAAPALAQGVRNIRLVSTFPPQLGGLGNSLQRTAKAITDHSGGRLNVTLYPPGALVGPFDVHDAVGAGDAEMYFSAEYYYQKKSRAFAFFSTVPMGLTIMEHMTWLQKGGGQALWDELSAGFGVKSFANGGTGPQTGGWFKNEIKTIDDFRGITMRMPGLGGEVLERFGAKAVVMPGGKIVSAFKAGEIDAMEWVGPWNDLHFGFQKLMQTFMFPGFHEPGTTTSVGLNLALWNDLSPQDKALITSVTENERLLQTASYHANNSYSSVSYTHLTLPTTPYV